MGKKEDEEEEVPRRREVQSRSQEPQPSRADSRSWLAQAGDDSTSSSAAAARASPSYMNKTCGATAMYEAEGQGYLSFKKDDQIQMLYEQTHPGENQDAFKSYLYGKNLTQPDSEPGWFPVELVRFDES